MFRKLSSVFVVTFFVLSFASAQTPAKVLSLGAAGVAAPNPETVTVAAPLANLSSQAVRRIKIEHIELGAATLKTSLPIKVGTIAAHGSEIVQAEFDSKGLLPGKRYELVVQGSYGVGRPDDGKDRDDKDWDEKGPRRPFKVRTVIVLPPASPGSHEVGTTKVPAHKTKGGRYPHQPPRMDKDVNEAAPPVPTTSIEHGPATPTGTALKPAPIGDPPPITFNANDPVASPARDSAAAATPQPHAPNPAGPAAAG